MSGASQEVFMSEVKNILKDQKVSIRLSQEENEALEYYAQKVGVKRATLVRCWILEKLKPNRKEKSD